MTEDRFSVSKLCTLQCLIPYYIGPLSQRSEHAWLERSSEKIFPWNFSQVVDVERSAEKFIERMTAKCSYLGEDILPRDSLLYNRFAVLNDLNHLRVHGKPISTELKQRAKQAVL